MAVTILPRISYGGWSSETIDGQGLEGRYVQLDWRGLTIEISFGSVAWHERQMERWRKQRETER